MHVILSTTLEFSVIICFTDVVSNCDLNQMLSFKEVNESVLHVRCLCNA